MFYLVNLSSVVLNIANKSGFWIAKHYSSYYKQYIDKLKDKCKKLYELSDISNNYEVGSSNYIVFFR